MFYLEFSASFKDSSLKKTGSLLKKLKLIQADQLDALLAEIKTVNLRMHLAEATSSILENRPKASTEIMGLLSLVLTLMVEYPDFRQLFVLELLKRIESESSKLDLSSKSDVNAFRCILRLALELHCIRVFNGQVKLNSVFENLLLQDQSRGLKLAPLVVYFLKNFELLTPQLSAQTSSVLADYGGIGDTFEKYYKSMCRYLASLHKSFLVSQKNAKNFYESKGDIGSHFASELTESYAKFNEAHLQLEGIAAAMNKKLPELPDSKPKYQIIDGKIIFAGDLSFLQNKNLQIFEDEEQRQFYEEFPRYERPEHVPDFERSVVDEPDIDEASIVEIDPDKDETPKFQYFIIIYIFILNLLLEFLKLFKLL